MSLLALVFLTTLLCNCYGFLEPQSNGMLLAADVRALKLQLETEQAKRTLIENNLSVAQQQLDTLTQQIQTLRQTACCGRSYGPQAFKAKMSHGQGLSTNQVITYDQLIINEGNGYDPTTGVYTAQLNGTYAFSINLCTSIGHYLVVEVMKNGVQIGQASSGDNTYNTCGSEMAVAHLMQGDRVWVQHEGNRGSGLLQMSSIWNSFSGTLAEAD